MKTTKKLATLAIVATTLFSASCKKDSVTHPGGPGGTPEMKIARIDRDTNNYSVFTYNSDGKVVGYTNNDEGTLSTVTATYNGKKVVTATLNDQLYKFSYNGDQLKRVDIYADKNNATDVDFYTEYTYTGGRISETGLFGKLDTNFKKVLKTVNQYNAAGDITITETYSLNPLTDQFFLYSTSKFEYDDKKNPLMSISDLTVVMNGSQSPHNVTKETVYDRANQVRETNTYTFTYNSNGYPTESTTVTKKPGEADVTTVNKFTYK
jgi:hypothetical protein